MKGVLCKDLYAEEIKFNIKGESQVASVPGQLFSFCVRIMVFVFFADRLFAWHSFDKFQISSYDKILDLKSGKQYSAYSLNFERQGFDFMIGFDAVLPPGIGHFEFSLLTIGEDGRTLEIEGLKSRECPSDHEGVAYAQRELAKTYRQEFSLQCFSDPEFLSVTGNKHSQVRHQQVAVSFVRCTPSATRLCWNIDETRNSKWFGERSVLVFAPQHRTMMNSLANPDEPTEGQLGESVFVNREFKKHLEIRIDTLMFTQATMRIDLHEVTLRDDFFFSAF